MVRFRNFLNFFQLNSRLVVFAFPSALLRFLINLLRVDVIQVAHATVRWHDSNAIFNKCQKLCYSCEKQYE